MPLNKLFQRRIGIIVACLRRRQRTWTIESLLVEVNEMLEGMGTEKISRSTLYDDLKHMALVLGAPIEKCQQGKKQYYRNANPDFSTSNLCVAQEEISFLQDSLEVLLQIKELQINREIEAVAGKLEDTLSTTEQHRNALMQFEHGELAAGSATSKEFVEIDLFDPDSYFESVIDVNLLDQSAECIQMNIYKELAYYLLTKQNHSLQKVLTHSKSVETPFALIVQIRKIYEEGIANYQEPAAC